MKKTSKKVFLLIFAANLLSSPLYFLSFEILLIWINEWLALPISKSFNPLEDVLASVLALSLAFVSSLLWTRSRTRAAIVQAIAVIGSLLLCFYPNLLLSDAQNNVADVNLRGTDLATISFGEWLRIIGGLSSVVAAACLSSAAVVVLLRRSTRSDE